MVTDEGGGESNHLEYFFCGNLKNLLQRYYIFLTFANFFATFLHFTTVQLTREGTFEFIVF